MSLPVPQPILYTEVPMYIYFVFLLLFWRSSAFPPSPTTLIEGDIAVPDQSRRNPTQSFYLINSANLWNDGLVPYSFEKIDFMGNGEEEDMFGEKEKKLIQDSLSHISSHVPCLRFKEVPSTSTVHRLIFSSMEEGCFSYVGNVGPQGGKTGQTVNLGFGCYNHKLVIHEVLHALGASHEQNRNDRDSHVKIHFENIKEGGSKNFKKKSSIFNSRGTPYDYVSIMQYGVTDFGIDGKVTISSDRHEISDPDSLSAIDIAELAEVYQGVTKENCYTQEMLLGYVGALEERIADLEEELKQTTAEAVETTTVECISKVPGGRCKIVGNGECWCEDEPIKDCSCYKDGGCPKGHYGKHAGWELCGYQEGYKDTYFPATDEAAQSFGYSLSSSPSCSKNSIRGSSSITPQRCPKHKKHCKDGFCSWLSQEDAWNHKTCGVQVCCRAFVRCINMESLLTIKTTTESNYIVTPLPSMDPGLQTSLPESSKLIYVGEGWRYFKIPIPAGNFNITGSKLAEVCETYKMETPCPSRLNCYHQKQCVETAHTYNHMFEYICISSMFGLQKAIADKGYASGDKDHLQYTFVYRYNEDDDNIDGACGYWPGYYCHIGKKTSSDGINKFALCSIQEK